MISSRILHISHPAVTNPTIRVNPNNRPCNVPSARGCNDTKVVRDVRHSERASPPTGVGTLERNDTAADRVPCISHFGADATAGLASDLVLQIGDRGIAVLGVEGMGAAAPYLALAAGGGGAALFEVLPDISGFIELIGRDREGCV